MSTSTLPLIPTFNGIIAEQEQLLVNARELHAFLEIGRNFADWIKSRIFDYDFVENQDYVCVSQNCETQRKDGQKGVTVRTDYHITLDMAKELSMVERNAKGKQARQYFIACEKALIGDVGQLHALTAQNQALKAELLKANNDYNAIKVMYDGGLENWQIGMAVNLSRHTISKRLTHLRKLGLIDDERGKHTPSERLVQSVDATNTQLTLGV